VFFYASKILLFLAQPSTAVALLLMTGTVLAGGKRRPLLGRRMLALGIVLLVVLGLSPIANILLMPLEERFPRGALPSEVAGVLVLGGFEEARISAGRGGLAVDEAADRLTEALLLARRLPSAKLIFTGGVASFLPPDYGTAEPISRFLEQAGIARERVVLESRSRNTYENAVLSRELLQPRPGQRYLLVTSAYHMPRALATFRVQGFDIIAWPVDYRTRDGGDRLRLFESIPEGLMRVDLAFKEWVGLVAYYLTGRSDAVWPTPRGG
jgi:uncharacterized SAM-binding protein YcdF (DUF218 family)